MCMFVFWENMTGCFRAIFACLIFLVLAGPVLIILGIVLLAAQNDRSKNVLTYNNQVSAYNSYDAIFLANTDTTVEGDDFSSSEDQVAIQGRLDGITLARHITLSNPYVRRTQNDYYNMTFWVTPPNATAPVVSTFELWLPWSAVTTATLYCTAASCTSNCASQNFVCARSTMQAVCQSAYVGTYSTPSGTDCRPGDACGQCTYTGQLTSACVVIAFNGPIVRRSTMYTSCNYPFSSFEYAAVISGSVELTVMSENDPWIMLESLTQGSDDFGATSAQQRASGVTLLVVGLIVTGVVGVLLYCLIQKHTTASDEHPAPPFAPQAVAPQNCEPQQMQPAYGYGPQVMYAQQAPPPQVYSPQTAEHMQQAPTPQNHQAFPAPNGHEPHPDGEGSVPKPTMAV